MKTAVEQLLYYLPNSIKGQFKEQIEQAKEMEKERIKYAYLNGRYDADKIVMSDKFYAEQYYNETFKQQQ
jgi:hypothetical protein